MTKQEFLRQLEDIMELDANTLQGGETLKDLDSWDSLASLSFIAFADERFNLSVSGNQVASAKTVDDLAALLGDRIAG